MMTLKRNLVTKVLVLLAIVSMSVMPFKSVNACEDVFERTAEEQCIQSTWYYHYRAVKDCATGAFKRWELIASNEWITTYYRKYCDGNLGLCVWDDAPCGPEVVNVDLYDGGERCE